jgi:hypothetical protein
LGLLFDVLERKSLYQHDAPLNTGATFYRDGTLHCIIGTYTGEALVFRLTATSKLEHVVTVRLLDNAVKGIACNKDIIFSVGASGAASLFRIDTLERIQDIPAAHGKISNAVTVLQDGRFASVGRDLRVLIWRGTEARELPHVHARSIKCIAACASSGLIATGSYDGTIAIHDEGAGITLRSERPTAAGISSIVAGDEAGLFLAASYDGCVYRLACHG